MQLSKTGESKSYIPLATSLAQEFATTTAEREWIDLSAAVALTEKAANLVQAAWQESEKLTAEKRGECAVAIAAAKVLATRVGLNIASRMFEFRGSRGFPGL